MKPFSYIYTNNGVRGELGRYPLSIFIQTQTVKYATRLMTLTDPSCLLYDAYQANINMCSAGFTCWLSNMKYTFNTITHPVRNNLHGPVKSIPHIFEQAAKNLYSQQWHLDIHDDSNRNGKNKLRTYRTFKTCFEI